MTDPGALGRQHQLGSHKATYKSQVGCAIAIGLFVVALLSIPSSIGFFSTIVYEGFHISNLFLLIPPLLATVLIRYLIEIYRNRVIQVLVYDNGFIHLGRKSSQTIIYWQKVREIRHKVTVSVSSGPEGGESISHTITVSCTDGTLHELPDNFLANFLELGKSIEVETARCLFPTALKMYQMSHSVTFGPLTVTPQGCSHRSNLLLWSEMESIKFDERYGRIKMRKWGRRSVWASLEAAEVPNVEVFRMLVEHVQPRVLQ